MKIPNFLRKFIDKIRLPLMLAALSLVNRKYLRREDFIYQLDVRKKYGRFFPYLVTCLGATGRALRINCLSCNEALYRVLKAQKIPVRLSFGLKLDAKTILVTDGNPRHEPCLSISYDYFRHTDDGIMMPFSLAPSLYERRLEIFGELFQSKERGIRVAFIGNSTHQYSPNMQGFELPDRYTLINQIAATFRERVVFYENYPREKGKIDILLAVTGDISGERHLAMHVKQDEYLKLLANSDFFICTPGAFYPYCHNKIEAMACGSIPITCYADYMHPVMRDMENCLIYKTPEELGIAVAKALALPQEEIARLRANARAYYEKIKPDSLAEKILQKPRSRKLYFVNGLYTKDLLRKRLADQKSVFFSTRQWRRDDTSTA